MKIFVKTLKGTRFEIQVKPEDSVADVKKNIETVLGGSSYSATQQILIHKGKVLKDETTMEANNISEKGFIAIMKSKPVSIGASTESSGRKAQAQAAPPSSTHHSVTCPTPTSVATLPSFATENESSGFSKPTHLPPTGPASSNLVPESSIQELFDMGRGTWSGVMVACVNREMGVPVETANPLPLTQEPAAPPAAGDPNGFYYLPEGLPNNGSLDFLRHTKQFQVLQPLVLSNPSILKGILQEIKKQNPPLFRMIQDNKADFVRLLKGEPIEGGGGSGNQMAQSEELEYHEADLLRFLNNEPSNEGEDGGNQMEQSQELEHEVFTPEDCEAIERLEAMGFERVEVVVMFLICKKNEELTAKYLLDHDRNHQF